MSEVYTIHALAQLSGVTTRTLRFYDEIGLLPPLGTTGGGCRTYGPAQLRRLQQILFYRALGVACKDIAPLLAADTDTKKKTLQRYLNQLVQEQTRLSLLADTVQKTILELEGDYTMKDTERFAGLKKQAVEQNEAQYGAEIRAKYGDAAIDASNARVKGMSEDDWQRAQDLQAEIAAQLRALTPTGDAAGAQAMQLADLHRQWLCLYWPKGQYSKEAHRGLAQMYLADARFTAYYEAIAPGATAFLCRAIGHYCEK